MGKNTLQALTCQQAFELLASNPRAVLIDIRSTMEFLFVGHPKGSVHVPWIDEPDWDINPNFVLEVRKLMLGGVVSAEGTGGSAPIVLICRSGKRSIEAGKQLLSGNFSDIYHIDEGFEGDLDDQHQRGTVGGWRHHGLPWEQC